MKDVVIRLLKKAMKELDFRVKIKDLQDVVRKVINGENLFKLGKKVNTRKK